MAAPAISVVIPNYNKGDLVLKTVASVQASKEVGPLEIIVVDDRSTDPLTLEALKQLRKEPDVQVLENEGKGPGAARNRGLRAAAAPYLLFLDNDDLLAPNFLKAALDHLAAQPADVAYAYPDLVLFTGPDDLRWRPTPEFSLKRLRIFNTVPVSCLYRTEDLCAVGGMATDLSAMEDWDLFLKLADAGRTGSKIPDADGAWLLYRQVAGGVNASAASPAKRIRLRRRILRRHKLLTPLSWTWDLAAVIFGMLAGSTRRRERQAFAHLPVDWQRVLRETVIAGL